MLFNGWVLEIYGSLDSSTCAETPNTLQTGVWRSASPQHHLPNRSGHESPGRLSLGGLGRAEHLEKLPVRWEMGKQTLQHLLWLTLCAGVGLPASLRRCHEGPGPAGARPQATGHRFPAKLRVFCGVSAARGHPEPPPPSYPRRLFLLPRPPSLPAGRRGQPWGRAGPGMATQGPEDGGRRGAAGAVPGEARGGRRGRRQAQGMPPAPAIKARPWARASPRCVWTHKTTTQIPNYLFKRHGMTNHKPNACLF